MPPVVTITAWAVSSNSPAGSRLEAAPRGAGSGASRVPRTPVTTPSRTTNSSTRWRWWKVSRPAAAACRASCTNGPTTPVPVPQGTWKRGTELPWPSARRSPRSAQPTSGVSLIPRSVIQARFSPAAKST